MVSRYTAVCTGYACMVPLACMVSNNCTSSPVIQIRKASTHQSILERNFCIIFPFTVCILHKIYGGCCIRPCRKKRPCGRLGWSAKDQHVILKQIRPDKNQEE